MHMPGHKRNGSFLPLRSAAGFDITEISGFDDLHCPQGILANTQKSAANLYGSKEAFMLINGSTVGVLAAIGAHCKRKDKILTADNCHVSVPNAAELFGLDLVCINAASDKTSGVSCGMSPESIEAALIKDPQIRAVVVTSPTYEGVVSDIDAIAKTVHKAGIILIVDCAHGAHLGFSDAFPKNPVSLGADIVIMSLHKTLPALTQCSLLHVCSDRADTGAIKRMLDILQTTSPSYLLMASIDYCVRLLETDADRLFREYEGNLKSFLKRLIDLRKLSVLEPKPAFFALDPGKIVIVTKNRTLSDFEQDSFSLSGYELADILRKKYKIELERAYESYAIAMTSICDTPDGFERLADALLSIDAGFWL